MDEESLETTYKWTIRGLYLVAIGAELILLWHSEMGKEIREKFSTKVEHLKDCEPCAKRRQWLHDKSRMLWQAETTIEGSYDGPTDADVEDKA